jgi:hypothetical protein
MKFSGIVLAATVALGISAAHAQDLPEYMSPAGWQRMHDHIDYLDRRLAAEVSNRQIPPMDAWALQKELDACSWWALYQHDRPNDPATYDIGAHLRHVHQVLNEPWGW